jgi:hypothetical protein
MKDDGYFDIPAAITANIHVDSTVSSSEMSLTRVRQVSFVAPGISSGDFSFVATTGFLVEFNNIN